MMTLRLATAAAALTLAALAFAACDTGEPVTGDIAITDSAGVTLVRFADLASLDLPARGPALEREVGTRPGTELYRVTVARLLESGRLVIGNSGTGELLYVDESGEIAIRAGGEGDGPGEFRAITVIPAVRGDTIVVYDTRLGRLTTLDAAGELVDTRPLQPPSRVTDLLPLATGDSVVLAIHGDSWIFGASRRRRRPPRPPRSHGAGRGDRARGEAGGGTGGRMSRRSRAGPSPRIIARSWAVLTSRRVRVAAFLLALAAPGPLVTDYLYASSQCSPRSSTATA